MDHKLFPICKWVTEAKWFVEGQIVSWRARIQLSSDSKSHIFPIMLHCQKVPFVRQRVLNSEAHGGYMGIVGGKKIVKYSLIQRPQTDVSSAESGLKMCIVWLIRCSFNLWITDQHLKIRFHSRFFSSFENSKVLSVLDPHSPWYWPPGPLCGACTFQFTSLHLVQLTYFIHLYNLPGP